jgi:GNAT superfamily N-acetyltransferase
MLAVGWLARDMERGTSSMIQIERASAEDADKLRQIGVQAFAHDSERYGAPTAGIDLVENHREWIERYHYYKITAGAEIIGGVMVVPDGDCYYLEALFITPALQNQGMGTRAMRFVEEAYPTAEKWALYTAHLSHRTQRFYEKLGYEKVGQTNPGDHPEMPDQGFHLLLYEKRMAEQPEAHP